MRDPCFIPLKPGSTFLKESSIFLKKSNSTLSNTRIQESELPERFPYPFCYTPDSIALLAAQDLQQFLENSSDTKQNPPWRHNFGDILAPSGERLNIGNAPELAPTGKMFGVLVVKNDAGELGYLAGFSGKLADQNHWDHFVAPIFDTLKPQGQFLQTTDTINAINQEIKTLETSKAFKQLSAEPDRIKAQAEQAIEKARLENVSAKAERKLARQACDHLDDEKRQEVLENLAKQSVQTKQTHLRLKQDWAKKIQQAEQEYQPLQLELEQLKQQRKTSSNQLQHWLFEQYRVFNAHGHSQTLAHIFEQFPAHKNHLPPAGAGECAAPKLINHAYLKGYQIITMAEFWWGESPASEIRQHKNFYPACQSKCLPILSYMLEGIEVDDNPLLNNAAEGKVFEIIYQDDAIVVVNKPAELLSVPGVHIKDSVFTRLQAQFKQSKPDIEGPFVVHRLDMSTSGLLVFALTKRANKSLQKQFITRQVKKRYIAVLSGDLAAISTTTSTAISTDQQGEIDLPLTPDITDRPRQKVCYDEGKPALTQWQVIGSNKGKTKLYLYPQTGRTHQLRVHCAHAKGLNCAILGDDLYGRSDERLCLHAEQLSFEHPYTKEQMTFIAPDPFV